MTLRVYRVDWSYTGSEPGAGRVSAKVSRSDTLIEDEGVFYVRHAWNQYKCLGEFDTALEALEAYQASGTLRYIKEIESEKLRTVLGWARQLKALEARRDELLADMADVGIKEIQAVDAYMSTVTTKAPQLDDLWIV